MPSFYWLIVFLIFLAIEGLTVSLTSIWFAGGALGALIAGALGGDIQVQLVVFVAVSFLLLLLVRPLSRKYLRPGATKTNVDSLIGKRTVVKERIDNLAGTGLVQIGAQTWMARSAEDGKILEPGAAVKVVKVQGARLIVQGEEREEVC